MTDFTGLLNNSLGVTSDLTNRVYDPDVTADAKSAIGQPPYEPSFAGLGALLTPGAGSRASGFPTAPVGGGNFTGHYTKKYNAAEEWFELIHVLPRSIALGNVLSTVQVTMDIFNADRYLAHVLQAFINNAGAGLSIIDLPTLPYQIEHMEGLQLTLEVTPDGPASIDGTLDFDFDLYTVAIPITGSRIVLFPYVPEKDIVEWLRFGVQVIEKKDGREQRMKMRKSPRQEFHFKVRSDGTDRQAMQHLLYDWQGRVFGLPVWTEPSYLTAAVAPGATSLPVDTTRYGDFRVDSLLILFTDRKVHETLTISSIGPNVLNIASPLAGSFAKGTWVMPVRTALLGPQLQGSRQIKTVTDLTLRFMVTDNDVNIASTAAFETLAGKVLFSDPNLVDGEFPEILARRLYVVDNEVGLQYQTSIWDRQRRGSQKGFATRSRQKQWELKQMMYALGGRLNSFYLPTFYDDLLPNANLVSGSPDLSIENVGYTSFIQDKKDRIRVHLTNGTILDRTILASQEIDEDTELLTMNTTWPSTITPAQVERIEYVEKVRFDTDDIEIVHHDALGQTHTRVPVVEVIFE